jgi:hypothetical protein
MPTAELLGEHARGLIDLGAVQGQARGLAARAGPCLRFTRRLVLGAEQQQAGSSWCTQIRSRAGSCRRRAALSG